MDEAHEDPGSADPLRCGQPIAIPVIEPVNQTIWSPDGARLAYERIVTSPSSRTVTGYEEDLVVGVLDVAKGTTTEVGMASWPQWSGSGTYLSYWDREQTHLLISRGGSIVARLVPSLGDVRWVGDQLEYWSGDEIRIWDATQDVVLSRVDPDFEPKYPADDVYFSADGALFTLTRYRSDGSAFRYVGQSRNGQLAPLDTPGAVYTEWAPVGETLLVRSSDRIELRGPGGEDHVAPVSAFPGPIHGWAPDGKTLLVGSITPTVPAGTAFDRFVAWNGRPLDAAATLPNLLGSRSFSPDGRYFAGVARTSLYGLALEVFRCGTNTAIDGNRADPAARARQQRIDAEARRFVRPVAGWLSQFVQGAHTGVDVAAPYGSVITADDDGTVGYVGWVQVGGRAVCVEHGGGLQSCFYHTSLAFVVPGQRVVRGQPVAAIGMTGLTTGPHVHWEVKLDGRIVDPLGR